MTRLPINKHKRVVKLLRIFLTRYRRFFVDFLKIRGIKFDIRGKVGVAGNSKKRHYLFSTGDTSFSQKKHRLEYKQGLVYTNTGVLGVTLIYVF